MQRVKLTFACLLCLSLVGVARGQTALESDSGVAVMQDYSGSATFAGTYFDIRTMTGDGVGYRNGYTTLGMFTPIWLGEDSFLAPNSRLIVTDLGDVGLNSGGVFRKYVPERDRVFGANLYYDYDQSVEGFTYHQFGFGLETLGEKLDARANVYLPTTDNDNFVRPLALDCITPLLQGNQIGFLATGLYQQSVEGADFEVGLPLTKSTPWLRGYGGAYFYDAPKDNPIGVRARMEAQISNDLTVGVNVTNDTNFGTNVNAVVDFRFSGWLPTRYFPNYTVRERMLAPVQRNWRIATANTARDEFAAAKNPDTGRPYFLVWVDNSNTNAGPGTGSFEDPLDNLPATAPGADIIVVKAGDSTFINPYRGSIVLQDNQRLLGEGKAHQVDLLPMYNGLMCPVMAYNLPGIATDGNFPFLTSVGNNNVVTLQDNNEVSAFNIVRAGGIAITNFTGLGSRDFNLNCLNLLNNTGGGIVLGNASGTGMIKTVNAINNTAGGIFIDSAPAGLNLTVMDVVSSSVAATPGYPQAYGFQLFANPGQITATITDAEFNRNTVGMILRGAGGDLNVTMNSVSVDNNLTDGAQLITANSDVDLFLQNSTFNRNGGAGFTGIMTGGSLDMIGRNVTFNNNDGDNLSLDLTNTRMAVDFRNAIFNNSTTGNGIVISNTGGNGTGTAVFNNITSTGNFLDGFQFNGDNFANIDATVTASILSDNFRDAFSVSGSNSAQVGLSVGAVIATGSGRHGLNFNATSEADLDLNFLATDLDFSGSDAALAGRGVNGFADNATVSLTMGTTTAENSGADGMFVTAVNNAQVGISVQNGNFANSGQNTPGSDGVHLVTDTGATVVMQINNTPINNSLPVPGGTQDDGLVIESSNNSTVLANISNSDLSNNLSNAIETTVNTSANVTINLLNSNGLNSGEDGIRFDVQNGGQLAINLQSSDFDFSGQTGIGNGIIGFVRTGGDVTLNAIDSSFSNSAENGFELDIANIGSSFTMNMESGNFSDSGRAMLGIDRQDAFHITAGDQALVDITLFTTPSANTGGLAGTQQRGLWATVTTGADLIFDDSNGDLSGNLLNAINLSVANVGSTATLNITDTPANNSGQDGFIFNVVDSALLQATFLRSTLDSSGLAGVPGDEFDAIDGTLDTNGIALLSFTDTAVTNAFKDGMRIVASNDAVLVATFNNSPLDNSGTNNGGDAIRLTFDSGADGVVTLQNGSTATNAGDDAVFISAIGDGTTVVLNADASDFSNSGTTATANGGNAIAAFVSVDAAVQLNIVDTNMHNTTPTLPQLRGLLFDVQSGGMLLGNFDNVLMDGHDLEGISGSVDGANIADSTVILTLVDTVVDDNGTFGAIFNVTNDGDLSLDASGTSSFSQNQGTGILANVDGAGSTFDLVLDATTVDFNGLGLGGDGIAITGDNNAFISGDVTNASISNNANAGVVLTLLNGSTANFAQSFVDTTIDLNGNEGVVATVESGSTLLLNFIRGSISDNGTAGTFDNVNIFATDAGTMVETRFEGTVADNATRSGFNFTTLNGAMNLTQIRAGVTANGNLGGNGLRFVADGAGTQAVLFMSDTSADGLTTASNSFADNGASVLTALGGPDADLPLTGGGIFFQATNVDIAAARISGLANDNGNAFDANRDLDLDGDGDHDGIFVRVDGANQFAFEIGSGTSANNNVDDGIDVEISNVLSMGPVTKNSVITPPDLTIGAGGDIIIQDAVANGNAGNGISLIIDGPVTIGDILIDNVSSVNNGGDGLLVMLTDVSNLANDLDLSITNSTIDTNGGRGIAVIADNSPFDEILIDNNTILSSMTGDGLLLDLTDSGANVLTITNNTIGLNNVNGVNIDLDNSPIGTLNITNNQIGLAQGSGGSFLDDSLPVIRAGFNSITLAPNDDGSSGVTPVGFTMDFFGQVFNSLFVNNNGNVTFNAPLFSFTPFPIVTNGIPMMAPFFADVDTRNHGSAVTYGNGTIAGRNAFGVNWVDVDYFISTPTHTTQLNDFQLILIDRSDISVGDFDIEFNYGTILWETGDASGGTNGLGGSSARVGFTNGSTNSLEFPGSGVNGALLDSGPSGTSLIQNLLNSVNLGRYRFAARDGGIGGTSPNGGDGILINATNGSDIGNVNITGNTVQDNGQHGIEILVDNSALGPIDLSTNTITGNGDDGFRLVNPNLTNALIDINVASNTIEENGGRGVAIVVPDGINVNLALTDNTSISGNGAEGVLVDLNQNSVLNATNVYGNTIGTAALVNGGAGLRIDASTGSTVNLNLGDSAQAANSFGGNTSAGAAVTLNGNAIGNITVQNTTIANTAGGGVFGGDGLALRLTDTASMPNLVIGDAGVANTSFTDNTGDGVSIELNGFSQLVNATVQNISSTDNTGDGLNVLRQGSGVIDNFTITDSIFTGNQDGVHLQAEFAFLDDEYTLTNNIFDGNTANGVQLNAQADARIGVNATNNTFNGNGADGLLILTTAVSAGDTAEVFSINPWTQNDFSNNGTTAGAGGAGMQISGSGFFNLTIGVLNPDPQVFSNTFNDNAGDGIEINARGGLTLVDAQITGNNTSGSANGLAGIDINSPLGNTIVVSNSDISNNLGDGVEIDNDIASGSSFTFTDNTITFNGRDGIEYVDFGSGTLTVNGTGVGTSLITDNGTSGTGGRGIDIVAAGTFANSTVNINNTSVLRNAQEGVNVILTADAAQGNAGNRDALSSAALANGGALTDTPFLNFTMTNSTVNNNGQVAGSIGGSGLVMRVGTTRGGQGIAAAGGFASAGNGGVVASVTGNTLLGNFGADVIFESFVSIGNPGNSGVSWTDQNENPRNNANDVFDATNYDSDPIARLDLTFSNNNGEELDVTRLGAFYNNNDTVFKSRGITGVGPDNNTDGGADDNGPFGTGARHRNAQRLANRIANVGGTQLPPLLTIGGSDNYLFPGMGQSTFRVNDQGLAANNFSVLTTDFQVDDFTNDGNPAIFDSIFDANGVINPASPIIQFFDRMPFGWSTLP